MCLWVWPAALLSTWDARTAYVIITYYRTSMQYRSNTVAMATGTDNCQHHLLELERISLDLVWTEAYHIPQAIHTSYPSNILDS